MKPLSIHYAAFYFIRKVMKLMYSLQGNKSNTKKKHANATMLKLKYGNNVIISHTVTYVNKCTVNNSWCFLYKKKICLENTSYF